jgi:hypothetical protein
MKSFPTRVIMTRGRVLADGPAGERVDVSTAGAKSRGEDEKPSAHTSVTASRIGVLTHLSTGTTLTRVD